MPSALPIELCSILFIKSIYILPFQAQMADSRQLTKNNSNLSCSPPMNVKKELELGGTNGQCNPPYLLPQREDHEVGLVVSRSILLGLCYLHSDLCQVPHCPADFSELF